MRKLSCLAQETTRLRTILQWRTTSIIIIPNFFFSRTLLDELLYYHKIHLAAASVKRTDAQAGVPEGSFLHKSKKWRHHFSTRVHNASGLQALLGRRSSPELSTQQHA